jgi:membrane protease YdiL (CAAX protease family)
MAVLIVAVGPALGEELFCRGFLGRGLVARYGTVAGISLTSILFGVMHIIPAQAMYAGLLGILLHCLALSGRSLWLAMLAHFLNNALSVMAACDDSPLKPMLEAAQRAVEAQPAVFMVAGVVVCAAVMRHLQKDHGR